MRRTLGLDEGWAAEVRGWQDAVNELHRMIERLGVTAVIVREPSRPHRARRGREADPRRRDRGADRGRGRRRTGAAQAPMGECRGRRRDGEALASGGPGPGRAFRRRVPVCGLWSSASSASTVTRQIFRTLPCKPSCNKPRPSRRGGQPDDIPQGAGSALATQVERQPAPSLLPAGDMLGWKPRAVE